MKLVFDFSRAPTSHELTMNCHFARATFSFVVKTEDKSLLLCSPPPHTEQLSYLAVWKFQTNLSRQVINYRTKYSQKQSLKIPGSWCFFVVYLSRIDQKNKKIKQKQTQRTPDKRATCSDLHKAKVQRKTQPTLLRTLESSSSSSPAMVVAALLLRAAQTTPGNSYGVFRFLYWSACQWHT